MMMMMMIMIIINRPSADNRASVFCNRVHQPGRKINFFF